MMNIYPSSPLFSTRFTLKTTNIVLLSLQCSMNDLIFNKNSWIVELKILSMFFVSNVSSELPFVIDQICLRIIFNFGKIKLDPSIIRFLSVSIFARWASGRSRSFVLNFVDEPSASLWLLPLVGSVSCPFEVFLSEVAF